jgi:hypothetical protein
MRIAIYGDIHALDAVLADIGGQNVDQRYCLAIWSGMVPSPTKWSSV